MKINIPAAMKKYGETFRETAIVMENVHIFIDICDTLLHVIDSIDFALRPYAISCRYLGLKVPHLCNYITELLFHCRYDTNRKIALS